MNRLTFFGTNDKATTVLDLESIEMIDREKGIVITKSGQHLQLLIGAADNVFDQYVEYMNNK